MSTINDLLLEEKIRLLNAAKEASQRLQNARVYEEIKLRVDALSNIKDLESQKESVGEMADYLEDCNARFEKEGVGAYDNLTEETQHIVARDMSVYNEIADNTEIKDAPEELSDLDMEAMENDIINELEAENIEPSSDSYVMANEHGHVVMSKGLYDELNSYPEDIKQMQLGSMATREETEAFKLALDNATDEWGLPQEERQKLENDYAATNEFFDANENHPQETRQALLDNVKEAQNGWDKIRDEALEKNPNISSQELDKLKDNYKKTLDWDKTCAKSRNILDKAKTIDTIKGGDEKAAFEAFKQNQSEAAGKGSIAGAAVSGLGSIAKGVTGDDPAQGVMDILTAIGSTALKIFDIAKTKKKAASELLEALQNGDLTKETVQTQTFVQAKEIKPEELAKSQTDMQKGLEQCSRKVTQNKQNIDINNKMPNGDSYKISLRYGTKNGNVPTCQCTLSKNGTQLAKGKVKDVMKAYSKEIKKSLEAAKKAGKTAAKNAARTNPYSAIASAAKEIAEKGIKLMKNEKLVQAER